VTVRVRIAPSPTGNLHIGTARTAVFNWLFARHHQGTFILRIEDTDLERSRPEFTQNILDGLQWLGLNWDEGPIFQTQRFDLYHRTIQQLLDQGKAYRCYCSEAELEQMREGQKAHNQAPRYDNRHRHLTPEQRSAFAAEGREAVVRFIIDDERSIQWTDLVRGTVTWKGSDLGGDMVIARRSPEGAIGQPLYNLAVVADDIDMAITQVIRGEDHIANTAKQILLYEALGSAVPEFAHTPLILNGEGRKLSKRDGATSVRDFQDLGYTPEALTNYMTLLGWSPPEGMEERFSLAEAAQVFEFSRVNKAGARFDWDKLNWLNAQVLHELDPEDLLDRLLPLWQAANYALDPEADRQWLLGISRLLQPSLTTLQDAVPQAHWFFQPITYDEAATSQLQQPPANRVLANLLQNWSPQPFLHSVADAKTLIDRCVQEQGLKKGLVMKTLRAALLGTLQGPDLIETWLLLHAKQQDSQRLKMALDLAQQMA
jgi:glutamyl-tRNA synthetase